VRLSARRQGGALGLAGFDIAEHTLVLGFCDLRPLEGGVGEGVADLAGGFDGFLEGHDEAVVDAFLDEDAAGGGADLALVAHYAGEQEAVSGRFKSSLED